MDKKPTKRQLSNAGATLGKKGGVISAKVKKAKAKGKTFRKPKVVNKPKANASKKEKRTFLQWLNS